MAEIVEIHATRLPPPNKQKKKKRKPQMPDTGFRAMLR
jgi:hypothetical protein